MVRWPVASNTSAAARSWARTRSTMELHGWATRTSSSLTASTPPRARSRKIRPLSSGESPSAGFIIVTSSGRSGTPSRSRMPATPSRGPRNAPMNDAGSARSMSRSGPWAAASPDDRREQQRQLAVEVVSRVADLDQPADQVRSSCLRGLEVGHRPGRQHPRPVPLAGCDRSLRAASPRCRSRPYPPGRAPASRCRRPQGRPPSRWRPRAPGADRPPTPGTARWPIVRHRLSRRLRASPAARGRAGLGAGWARCR